MKLFATIWLIVLLACSQAAFAVSLMEFAVSLLESAELAVSITGTIVRETDTTIEVKSARDGSTMVLDLAARPYIVDAVTGQPLGLQDRTTDHVIAYYGPVVTQSLPPRSNPIVILCNVPQEGYFVAPQYARVESLIKANDHVKVMVHGGSLIVTIPRDAPISPYLTRNIVTIDNIEVGADLLLWYPFVALSYPGQATAQKTVILGKAQRGLVAIHMGSSVVIQHVNGAKATLYTYTIRGNGHYVKLRDVAYRLSGSATPFNVSWDGAMTRLC